MFSLLYFRVGKFNSFSLASCCCKVDLSCLVPGVWHGVGLAQCGLVIVQVRNETQVHCYNILLHIRGCGFTIALYRIRKLALLA